MRRHSRFCLLRVCSSSISHSPIRQKIKAQWLGHPRALTQVRTFTEEIKPNTRINVDKVGDMAVVECEGRFVRSEEAFKLRDAVASQADANVIVLDEADARQLYETYPRRPFGKRSALCPHNVDLGERSCRQCSGSA
jgi:hypothetical protein